jgi:hypothetical protein
MSRRGEGGEPDQQPMLTRRRFVVAGVVLAAAGGAAGLVYREIIDDKVEKNVRAIEDALNQRGVARGVETAIDYHLVDPSHRLSRPDGGENPIVLGNDTYGYISFDTTGRAEVVVAPDDWMLEVGGQDSKDPDYIPNPHRETVDISRVYYDQPGEKSYLAVIGDQPGPIRPVQQVISVGSPLQVGS